MQNSTTQVTSLTDDSIIIPNKIHLRGLDDLTTKDIKVYCSAHTGARIEHLEWINDTAANIVYCNSDIAADVLSALTSDHFEGLVPSQLRPAKPLSTRLNTTLQVRLAITSDRKQPRAHETSRFYLLHPEHDPRENGTLRRRRSSQHSDRPLRRRQYTEEENKRRMQKGFDDGFEASMYDDNLSSEAVDGSSPSIRATKILDSYRPSRNRSASPQNHRGHRDEAQRSRSPLKARGASVKGRLIYNPDKELLPLKVTRPQRQKDLFSEELFHSTRQHKPELFPNKTHLSNHRRTDAIDSATDAADLLASTMTVPFTDGANESKSLADRITGPIQPENDTSRSHMQRDQGEGYNIKGNSSQGIAIKGGAVTLRELFPNKSNLGKELFAEKLKGRGTSRITAEDMFS